MGVWQRLKGVNIWWWKTWLCVVSTQYTIYRWCAVEFCTWNLYNLINQCHPSKCDLLHLLDLFFFFIVEGREANICHVTDYPLAFVWLLAALNPTVLRFDLITITMFLTPSCGPPAFQWLQLSQSLSLCRKAVHISLWLHL